MTQLSFDAGNRLPLLDITPISKPARSGSDLNDQFDSHLNRASAPPTSPVSSVASPASPSPASSSTDSASPQSNLDENEPTTKSESDTPDHDGQTTTSSANTQETKPAHANNGDKDKEQDHEGEDDVVLSEESAALVQQVAIVDTKTELKVDEETAEGVSEVDQLSEKELPAARDAAVAKAKKQLNQTQSGVPANNGNKTPATEETKTSTEPAVQPTEVSVEVPETSGLDATVVSEDPLEETAPEASEEKLFSVKPKTITITIKDGQTDETLDVVGNQEEASESLVEDSTAKELPEQTAKIESSPDTARVSNSSVEAGSAEQAGQQLQEQQKAVQVNSDLPAEANSDGDTSSDQGGSKSEQHADQGSPVTAASKSNVGSNSTAETSPITKQLMSATEAPVLRAEHSSSSTSASSGTDATSAADRARFVHRVYRALHVAHERGGEVRLRLSPPELGNLTLELKLHDGAMTAHIEAETSAARTLLLDNLSVLKERLAAQDIQVERFDVELRDQSRQHSPDSQSQDSDAGRNSRPILKKPFASGARVEEQGVTAGIRPSNSNGKLNVII